MKTVICTVCGGVGTINGGQCSICKGARRIPVGNLSNVALLPNNGHAPTKEAIAAHLREQADWIENGNYPDVTRVVTVLEFDGQTRVGVAGEPTSITYLLGLMHFAMIRHQLFD